MSASTVLGLLLSTAGAALLTVGLLGWRGRLPRNRFAGIRTPATLRSEAAFILANRVAAPPVLAAGAVCVLTGALALGTDGAMLTVIVAVGGAGTLALVIAGGLLGHQAATALPPPTTGCSGCTCNGGACTAT
ncbi:MAG: SdpI family protein [Pseudonocardiaceae bacterium]